MFLSQMSAAQAGAARQIELEREAKSAVEKERQLLQVCECWGGGAAKYLVLAME